ncbi:hypothetical protein K438DRAFT_2165627 [Mycena galopus ATCC 62051]|nr:hypothetical protein K438DRAFT_2165627 [Mycena galopus ATCC 62051]
MSFSWIFELRRSADLCFGLSILSDIAPEYFPFLLLSNIHQAQACVHGILLLGTSDSIPTGAFVDLWDAVLPWIAFLDEYEESLSGRPIDSAAARYAYTSYLSVIRFLNNDEATSRLIHSTPGLYVVVGRAWPHLIHAEEGALSSVSYLLAQWYRPDQWNPAAYEDLIVGSGETRLDLASLVVSQIRRMLPKPDSSVTEDTIPPHRYPLHCRSGIGS